MSIKQKVALLGLVSITLTGPVLAEGHGVLDIYAGGGPYAQTGFRYTAPVTSYPHSGYLSFGYLSSGLYPGQYYFRYSTGPVYWPPVYVGYYPYYGYPYPYLVGYPYHHGKWKHLHRYPANRHHGQH